MNIAIDLDDVCLDFIGGILYSYEVEFGEPFTPFSGNSWGPDAVRLRDSAMWVECGYKDWWGWLRDREWLWGKVFKAIPGAVGGVKRLRTDGHYMECVTSKPEWAEFAVWQFQARYRISFNRITIIPNGVSKLGRTDASIIVDDKRSTCEEFAADGRVGIQFNPGPDDGPNTNLLVAKNWPEVVAQIRGLDNG